MALRHANRKATRMGGFPLIIKRSLLIIRRSPNYCRPSRRTLASSSSRLEYIKLSFQDRPREIVEFKILLLLLFYMCKSARSIVILRADSRFFHRFEHAIFLPRI